MTSPQPSPTWGLFESIAPESYFDQLVRRYKFRRRKRIYSLSVVIWLMIYQRLHCDASLMAAVLALPRRWRQSGTRISAATGAYCQARQRVPTLVAEQVSDHIFEALQVRARACGQRPVWLVDGTTLRMEHEAELVRAFPPGHNRHGENRWPVMLLVAFHDAHSGLAARPSWGPMYGPQPASEQQLAAQALARVPADALVLGDGNFGIFAFAHTVVGSGRPVLLRLTAIRAKSMLGKRAKLGCHKVVWRASVWERKAHPELLPEAHLEGWVVVCTHPLKKGERLYFFTTLEQRPRQVLACYKLRWNIETDLRHLKRTVNLYQLRGRSLGVVEKEVLLAVTAYNLVRAVMFQAAQLRGCSPRQLSFAHVQAAVLSALPGLEQARSQGQREQRMRELVKLAAQLALPRRKRKRPSYPREKWKRGASFPIRTLHPKPQELP